MSISKEVLTQSLLGKSTVELEDLVHMIEEHFGYNVQLSRKEGAPTLTDQQKKELTSIIFHEPDVRYQLERAEKDRREGISTYSDDEDEFAQLLTEANNET